MKHHTQKYLDACIRVGILTAEKTRKYSLRAYNLGVVLKLYALSLNLPYSLKSRGVTKAIPDSQYTLTDVGLEWVFTSFKNYSLEYLQSVFSILFINADEHTLNNPHAFDGFNNLRGITGRKQKRGSLRPALVIHYYSVNKNLKRERRFDTLAQAREYLFDASKYYPIDSFKLYSIRTRKNKTGTYEFLEEAPVLIAHSETRGAGLRKYLEEKYK